VELLEWSELPQVPGGIGFAGPVSGRIDETLLIGGGANFPDKPLWETSKAWYDAIYLLDLSNPNSGWMESKTTLPGARAYGVSLSHPEFGLIHLGGSDGKEHLEECLLLELDGNEVSITELPALPEPLAYAAGALVGDTAYLVGGQVAPDSTSGSRNVLALDLSNAEQGWVEVEPIPGAPGRIIPVAGSHDGSFLVFGGCALAEGNDGTAVRTYLEDAWRFDPDGQPGDRWTRLSDMPRPAAAAPGPAMNLGKSFVAIVGGDDGTNVDRVDELRDEHPGFPPDMLAYHVLTDEWTTRPGFPKNPGPDPVLDPNKGWMPPVTTTIVEWNGSYIIPSGEIRPRVRSPRIWIAELEIDAPRFGALDWTALGIYLFALVLMGVYFSRREHGTEDFFLAGRRVPWWAAGISIFATQLSAITFMAIPAKSYASDWKLLVQSFGIFVMAPVVAYLFLPFFRRLNVTTAYEYLEHRFSVGIRMFGSAQYLLFQFGRMAVVVYLPAIALQAVTGIDVYVCILLMGVLCIVYTVLGGIEAVIWSDVLQTFVLLGGAILILVACASGVDGGVGELFSRADADGHLRLADPTWDFTREALPVVILGGIFINLVPYASDQSVVQRYLTTRDEATARKAIWLGGILAIPASILFFGLGSALYGFYEANPERLVPLAQTDQIVPWFLVSEIPSGIAGLVIAGIFAAAMSSLDSSMNSSATALVTDFYRRLLPDREDKHYLSLARVLTVVLGVIGTGVALVLASVGAGSIFDYWLEIVGLFASGLCGLFVLGIFTRRPGSSGAVVGIVVSVVILVYVKNFTDLSGLLYASIGVSSCFVAGWLTGLVLPSGRDVSGTTFAMAQGSTDQHD
jgi:SSS family transporter